MSTLAVCTMLGLGTDAASAVGVWVSGLITVGLLIYAAKQLSDARRQRDDQTRPFIIVDFDLRSSSLVSIAVRNIGQTAASDVQVHLNDPVESAVANVTWQSGGLFKEGVPLFAPGRQMTYVLDIYSNRVQAKLPMTFSGAVEYRRPHGKGEPFRETFTLDLSVYEGAVLPRKDLSDLADEVEKIRQLLAKQ